MATGTLLPFDQTQTLILDGTVDFSSDTLRASVVDTIPASTETLYSALSGDLSSNVNQAEALTSVAVSTVNTDEAKLDAADVVFTATGACTIAGFVIYDDTVTSPADALLFYGDIDDSAANIVLASGESVTLQFAATGIAVLAPA